MRDKRKVNSGGKGGAVRIVCWIRCWVDGEAVRGGIRQYVPP